MYQITSLKELKKLAKRKDGIDCFIALNGGFRSSKHINYNDNKFYILNFIDDSEQELTIDEMNDENLTNIGKAIKLNSLYSQ